MKSSADMRAEFLNYNRAGSGLGGNIALTTEMKEHSNYLRAPDSDFLNIAIGVANQTGETQYVYIKYLLVTDNITDDLIALNPLDVISGYSGRASVTTSGINIQLQGFTSDMYDVILTPYTNGLQAYVTKHDDYFTITGNISGTVSYLIIPKCGLAI